MDNKKNAIIGISIISVVCCWTVFVPVVGILVIYDILKNK